MLLAGQFVVGCKLRLGYQLRAFAVVEVGEHGDFFLIVSKTVFFFFFKLLGEQDGGGVGGCGEHLSPQIHQEYTFRHRSACITSAESAQEYLTSGK